MKDYSDIINIERPPLKHPRMPVENRAKSFMPFDALRGFNLAILTKQVEQQLAGRIVLSEGRPGVAQPDAEADAAR